MYVSKSVLAWDGRADSFEMLGREYLLPYSYLEHAEQLITNEGRHYLIDAVSNIKRAIDHRVKQISSVYKLKKMPCFAGSTMETMVELQIVKPLMLNDLVKIRNSVEHQFSDPPSNNRCQEYAEMVWYFLKSTDQLVKHVSSGAWLYDPFNEMHRFGFEGSPQNHWKNEYFFELPLRLITEKSKKHYFEFMPTSVQTGAECKRRLKQENPILLSILGAHADDDVIARGIITNVDIQVQLARLYFREG